MNHRLIKYNRARLDTCKTVSIHVGSLRSMAHCIPDGRRVMTEKFIAKREHLASACRPGTAESLYHR